MGDSKPPASAETKKSKRDAAGDVRETPPLTLWWRFFWMRRSGARMVLALIFAVPALLAAIYLALSTNQQAQVEEVIQWIGQSLGATGLRIGVEAALVVCGLTSLALLLGPGHNPYRYLDVSASVVPNTTILVDTENLAGNRDGVKLLMSILTYMRTTFLTSVGDKRGRVDLLFFMDAMQLNLTTSIVPPDAADYWIENINHAYSTLILNGFRLINSPHNPTSVKYMKGAADREIELIAFERALSGEAGQTFVIVSGDGDFAPLIYRLVDLSHTVQVWTWGKTKVYERVTKGISDITVVHFPEGKVVSANKRASQAQQDQSSGTGASQSAVRSPEQSSDAALVFAFAPHTPPSVKFTDDLSQDGMDRLYFAIYNTLGLCVKVEKTFPDADSRFDNLTQALGDSMKPHLTTLGFIGQGSSTVWLRYLVALRALRRLPDRYPTRGVTSADQAARYLYSLALETAQAALRAESDQNGAIGMESIAAQLATIAPATDEAKALLKVVVKANERTDLDAYPWRSREPFLNTKFIVVCARALGLLTFVEVSESPMLIREPQLTPLAEQIIHTELAVPVTASQEVTGTADIPPTE